MTSVHYHVQKHRKLDIQMELDGEHNYADITSQACLCQDLSENSYSTAEMPSDTMTTTGHTQRIASSQTLNVTNGNDKM